MLGGRTGPPANRRRPGRMLAVAGLLGALLPWVVVALVVAARDPLPAGCFSGPPAGPSLEGQILYAAGGALWQARADLSQPQKLLDYSGRAQPTPAATVSPGPSPAGTTPNPTVTPPRSRPARVLAAATSADRQSLLFLVGDPPDHPGQVSLRLLSLADPSAAPSEIWSSPGLVADAPAGWARISWLSPSTALFAAPIRVAKPAPASALVGVAQVA